MLTAQHFNALASNLAKLLPEDASITVSTTHAKYIRAIATVLAHSNPRFDPGKFFDACFAQPKENTNASP